MSIDKTEQNTSTSYKEKYDEETRYLLALSNFLAFGPRSLFLLKAFFNSYKSAFLSTQSNLEKAGISAKISAKFISERHNINIEKIINTLEKENIRISTKKDKHFPLRLNNLYSPPAILYYRGEIKNTDLSLSVVGSRKFSRYGKMACENIISDLAKTKITIISGLALGIDAIAHMESLKNNLNTIAILGSGVDNKSIYPANNQFLARRILEEGGAIVSEFPPGTIPMKHHFPQRNRIVSGISLGSLIIEAEEKSGALITARTALEQGKEVFAVPGSIFSSSSRGTNNIIKQGAIPTTSANDIIDALDLEIINHYSDDNKDQYTSEEKLILKCLSGEAKNINEIIVLSKLNVSTVSQLITNLELKEIIKNIGGMNYVLK